MSAQALARQVERGASAGAGLKKQVCESHAGQFAAFVGRLTGEAAVSLGPVENGRQRIARQAIQRDEVAQASGAVLL